MRKKIIVAVATAALFASTLTGATFAETNVDIVDNGADSTNTVVVSNTCTTDLKQKNKTKVETGVALLQNTGENTANNNTGTGDVIVKTGDAEATVTVGVTGSSNVATVDPCCCAKDTNVSVDTNGAGSGNTAAITNSNSVSHKQKNKTKVKTGVEALQNSGGNQADGNTGDGKKKVKTGKTKFTVGVTVAGGSNTLNP